MGENAVVLVRAADTSVMEIISPHIGRECKRSKWSLYNCEVFQYRVFQRRRGNIGSDMMFGKDLERLMWGLGMHRED